VTHETAGGRWVEVPPERIVRWVESFTDRHGPTVAEPVISGPMPAPAAPAARPAAAGAGAVAVVLRAKDESLAECHPPFPPLSGPPEPRTGAADWARLMACHAAAGRTVGVLLVRLGGYAAGVFCGDPPRLVAAKTGSRPVHGRSAAGGWSQHRFARRRENQAAIALAAAADAAVAVLGPHDGRLDAVVLGGDRRAMASVRDDPRLQPLLERAVDRFLTVPDPRMAVLRDSPRLFRAVRIRLVP
jgi:hypothetical protein